MSMEQNETQLLHGTCALCKECLRSAKDHVFKEDFQPRIPPGTGASWRVFVAAQRSTVLDNDSSATARQQNELSAPGEYAAGLCLTDAVITHFKRHRADRAGRTSDTETTQRTQMIFKIKHPVHMYKQFNSAAYLPVVETLHHIN